MLCARFVRCGRRCAASPPPRRPWALRETPRRAVRSKWLWAQDRTASVLVWGAAARTSAILIVRCGPPPHRSRVGPRHQGQRQLHSGRSLSLRLTLSHARLRHLVVRCPAAIFRTAAPFQPVRLEVTCTAKCASATSSARTAGSVPLLRTRSQFYAPAHLVVPLSPMARSIGYGAINAGRVGTSSYFVP